MNEVIKYDSEKAKIGEMLVSFKRSLLEVCKVYEFGSNGLMRDCVVRELPFMKEFLVPKCKTCTESEKCNA